MSDFDPLVFEFEYWAKRGDLRLEGRLIASIPQRGQVVDAGCGAGRLTVRLAERVGMVYGLDISERMLALARTRQSQSNRQNIRWVQGSLETLPFNASVFDAVVSTNVLQFVDIVRAFSEFKRVLKPGGKLILGNWTLDSARSNRGVFHVRRLLIARDVWTSHGVQTAFKYFAAKMNPLRGPNNKRWRPLTSAAFQEAATRFFPGAVFQKESRRMVMLWENT
jgi:SAM-dependent methyltransferase